MVTLHYQVAYSLLERIRIIFKGIMVAGRPHVLKFREQVLIDCSVIDYGVMVEGEETLLELCNCHSAGDIRGQIHRNGSGVIANEPRSLVFSPGAVDSMHRVCLGMLMGSFPGDF